LVQQREELERRVDDLRAFEREYRSRLKADLEGQLRDLEAGARGSGPLPPGAGAGGGGLASPLGSRHGQPPGTRPDVRPTGPRRAGGTRGPPPPPAAPRAPAASGPSGATRRTVGGRR